MVENNELKSEEGQDVAMTDADLSAEPMNGPDGDAGILRSVEQPSASQSSLLPEVKSEPNASKPPSSSPAAPALKMLKAAPKKKGTAATKKGPKKPKSASSKFPKKETRTGGSPQDDEEGSSDDETDNGPYCICRGPDDHRWMISCDVCEDWFHGECVNLRKDLGEKLIERFVCPNCTDGKMHYTKYKKTCSFGSCTNPARLYGQKDTRSVFCSNDHCDAWWASMVSTLPTKAAFKRALEVLTQEDFMGLLFSTADEGGWKLGDKPFGMHGLMLNSLL